LGQRVGDGHVVVSIDSMFAAPKYRVNPISGLSKGRPSRMP
jgi:hypothetical protein